MSARTSGDNIMQSPAEPRTFSQVVFTDTPHSYPPGAALTCGYTRTAAFQPSPRDWVGIFKVGWSTTKDYHTFVWVEPCLEEESATRKALFKGYYLPKDELDFYQFCYVDGAGQVRGASTPFCFKKPAGQSPESIVDEELLVITTQEEVDLSQREKAELQRELDQMRGENETLKNDRQMERRQAAGLKEQNEQKEQERSQLLRDMERLKEQNDSLRSAAQLAGQEAERLKEQSDQQEKERSELLRDMERLKEQNDSALQEAVQEAERWKEELKKQTEERQRDAAEEQEESCSRDACTQSQALVQQLQEKCDRAAVKMDRLQEEREQLRGRADAQSDEINALNSKLRERERELFKMKDGIQLLQVDLQSLEKEKQRLSAELQSSQSLVREMVEVKREDQSLQSSPAAPQNRPDDGLRAERQALAGRLQEAQRKLEAEREETRNAKSRSEFLEDELRQLREQLEKVAVSGEQAERKSGKHELQLVDMHAVIAELREELADKDIAIKKKEQNVTLVTREKEALARETQSLKSDMERLRRALDDFQASATSPAADASVGWQQQQQQQQQYVYMQQQQQNVYMQQNPEEINPYENIEIPGDTEEESLVCRLCLESFPGITQDELEQHEGSHRECPYCPMSCDDMEQLVYEDHVYSHQL